jgi:hypothetical protein
MRSATGIVPAAGTGVCDDLHGLGKASPLIKPDEACLGNEMLARLSLHVAAVWVFANREAPGGKREQPEVIMMRAMAARRARPAIARPAEIVDSLL